jgi:hypothetical protein
MKTFIAILSLLTVFLAMPAMAKKKGQAPAAPAGAEMKVVECDAVSLKVTLGHSGDEHVEYRITDQTKVTLNGATVAARDLRPGMVVKVQAGADHVATAVEAKDAPAHPDKHRVG